MSDRAIPPEWAAKIWHVLVEECGCRDDPDLYTEFRLHLGTPGFGGYEFRFVGALGRGGKFYCDRRKWWVGCYGEENAPERLEMISRANARLAELKNERVD